MSSSGDNFSLNISFDNSSYDQQNKLSSNSEKCKISDIKFDPLSFVKDENIPSNPKVTSIFNRQMNCSICNEDLTRTPGNKCPKCGYKPLFFGKYPMLAMYDDTVTADDILKEWGAEIKKINKIQNKYSSNGNRCKCSETKNKPCAHCRVKESCRELIENLSTNFDKTVPQKIHEIIQTDDHDTKIDNKILCEINEKKSKIEKNHENAATICKKIIETQKKFERSRSAYILQELQRIYGGGIENKKCPPKFNKSKLNDLNKSEKLLEIEKKSSSKTISARIKNKNSKIQNIESEKIGKEKVKKDKRVTKKKRHIRVYHVPKDLKLNFAGHKNCITNVHVPHNMGWLWTNFKQFNENYEPGFIPKSIKKTIYSSKSNYEMKLQNLKNIVFEKTKPKKDIKFKKSQLPSINKYEEEPVDFVKYFSMKKSPDVSAKMTQYNRNDFLKGEPYVSPFRIPDPNFTASCLNFNKFDIKLRKRTSKK